MELCLELGFQRAQLEGDAQVLINAINGEEDFWTWYGELVDDARRVLKGLHEWSLNFFHRDGNQCVHELAKLGLITTEELVWIEDCPNFIIPFVTSDTNYQ